MSDKEEPLWRRKARERGAEVEAKLVGSQQQRSAPKVRADDLPAMPDGYEGAVPELDAESLEKSAQVQTKQEFLDGLDIVDVFRKVGGRLEKNPGGKLNGIEVFCINPAHDNTNTEAAQLCRDNGKGGRNLYVCHNPSCDAHTGLVGMFALSRGTQGKLRGREYIEAESELLGLYGWTRYSGIDGRVQMLPPGEPEMPSREEIKEMDKHVAETSEESPPGKSEPESEIEPLASVTPISPALDEDEDADPDVDVDTSPPVAQYDWRNLLPEGTYLKTYMEIASRDDCVEAFHLAYALLLLGTVAGRQVYIEDQWPIYLNQYIVILGDSASGKSKAANITRHLVDRVAPFDPEEEPQRGIKFGGTPSSGQGMVKEFRRAVVVVPSGPGKKEKVDIRGGVKGIIEFSEFESFTQKLERDTTGIKDINQQFFDGRDKIGTTAKGDGEEGYYCTDAFASQVTTTQPRNVGNLVSSKDAFSGVLGRYLFFAGQYKKKQSRSKSLIPYLDPIEEQIIEIRDWIGESHIILDWSDEAGALWDSWHDGVLEPMSKTHDVFGRAPLQVKKICGLFAMNSMHEQIEVEDVQCAIEMWPFLKDSYDMLIGKLGATKLGETESRILGLIKRNEAKGKLLSTTELIRRMQNNGRANEFTREMILRSLEILKKLNEIHPTEPGKDKDGKPVTARGKQVERWYAAS